MESKYQQSGPDYHCSGNGTNFLGMIVIAALMGAFLAIISFIISKNFVAAILVYYAWVAFILVLYCVLYAVEDLYYV